MPTTFRRIKSGTVYLPLVRVATQEEAAQALKRPGAMILVQPSSIPKWLQFRCPCGCQETVALNLMAHVTPRWRTRFDRSGRVSVWPSIRRQSGCRSHFFVTLNEARMIARDFSRYW